MYYVIDLMVRFPERKYCLLRKSVAKVRFYFDFTTHRPAFSSIINNY